MTTATFIFATASFAFTLGCLLAACLGAHRADGQSREIARLRGEVRRLNALAAEQRDELRAMDDAARWRDVARWN